MSRQLKLDGEEDYIQVALQRAVLVAEGVKTATDHANGWFTMFIQGQTLPDEWLTAAFALSARRYDFGHGQNSYMAWIFPVSAAPKINAKFPILNAWIRSQTAVITVKRSQPQRAPIGSFGIGAAA
jgi:hypothetical protein